MHKQTDGICLGEFHGNMPYLEVHAAP